MYLTNALATNLQWTASILLPVFCCTFCTWAIRSSSWADLDGHFISSQLVKWNCVTVFVSDSCTKWHHWPTIHCTVKERDYQTFDSFILRMLYSKPGNSLSNFTEIAPCTTTPEDGQYRWHISYTNNVVQNPQRQDMHPSIQFLLLLIWSTWQWFGSPVPRSSAKSHSQLRLEAPVWQWRHHVCGSPGRICHKLETSS